MFCRRHVASFGSKHSWKFQYNNHQLRRMGVYTLGDGWTGALGTGSFESYGRGHQDNDDDDDDDTDVPFRIFDGPVTAASAGWGHTAFVSEGDLFLTGRPFDFQRLLRLRRLPKFLRKFINDYEVTMMQQSEITQNQQLNPISWIISLISEDPDSESRWKFARDYSVLAAPRKVHLPDSVKIGSSNRCLCTSAGLTAFLSEQGKMYMFGLNHFGQCGTTVDSRNVWIPEPVMGLSSKFLDLNQEYPITQMSLGLQHSIALNTAGHVYIWGKAERGQLGLRDLEEPAISKATQLRHVKIMSEDDNSYQWSQDKTFTHVASGMSHSALLSTENMVFVFGKNVSPPPTDSSKILQDSYHPVSISGLPPNLKILDLSCGSHHTALLMEDGSVYAFGLAADTKKPIFDPIQLIPPGVIEMPVRQFQAHFDRTTIVGKNGDQVLQVHLWSNKELRSISAFTPPWMDHFQGGISSVHRGWHHTVIVTSS
jgi:hypothetical protein